MRIFINYFFVTKLAYFFRFVNGFVEKVNGFDNSMIKHAPQKKKQSIFELADVIGIPRMLVDIRHGKIFLTLYILNYTP